MVIALHSQAAEDQQTIASSMLLVTLIYRNLQVHPENLSTQTDGKALASMQILVLQPAPQRNDNSRLKSARYAPPRPIR